MKLSNSYVSNITAVHHLGFWKLSRAVRKSFRSFISINIPTFVEISLSMARTYNDFLIFNMLAATILNFVISHIRNYHGLQKDEAYQNIKFSKYISYDGIVIAIIFPIYGSHLQSWIVTIKIPNHPWGVSSYERKFCVKFCVDHAYSFDIVYYTVSQKKGPTLKRYSSKLYGSILMIFGRNIQKSLE